MRVKKSIKQKARGFFIVEILIVLVIIGILTIALLPNFSTYTQRAKFIDNINAAAALRSAVDACILQVGTPGAAIVGCGPGSNGVPTLTYGTTYVNTVASSNTTGIITAASQSVFGTNGVTSYTYILTPTYNTNGQVTWTDTAGTCKTAGLC